MSFPGLVSKVTVGEHELSIQTESGSDFISTQVFAKGATLFSVKTSYEPTAQLMALVRMAQRQHHDVQKRCLQGEFCPPKL